MNNIPEIKETYEQDSINFVQDISVPRINILPNEDEIIGMIQQKEVEEPYLRLRPPLRTESLIAEMNENAKIPLLQFDILIDYAI